MPQKLQCITFLWFFSGAKVGLIRLIGGTKGGSIGSKPACGRRVQIPSGANWQEQIFLSMSRIVAYVTYYKCDGIEVQTRP